MTCIKLVASHTSPLYTIGIFSKLGLGAFLHIAHLLHFLHLIILFLNSLPTLVVFAEFPEIGRRPNCL